MDFCEDPIGLALGKPLTTGESRRVGGLTLLKSLFHLGCVLFNSAYGQHQGFLGFATGAIAPARPTGCYRACMPLPLG